jgi:aminoglycoside phosphotransferase (APT) family kinase protein
MAPAVRRKDLRVLDRRRPLTPDELTRIAGALPGDVRATGSEPLLGGLDWGTYRIDLERGAGPASLVLRRHDGSGERPLASARRLWDALTTLAATDLPVPRPVLFDDGALIGAPLVLMTRCPGRIQPPGADTEAWLRAYAAALGPAEEVERLVRVAAGRESAEWRDVIDLLRTTAAGVAPATPALRHRDVWFGNLLWTGDEVTGILDWTGACAGDPAGDIAYAGLDVLLVLGAAGAATFKRLLRADRLPAASLAWWELYAAADGLAWLDEWVKGYNEVGVGLTPGLARSRLDAFTAAARAGLDPAPRTPRP